MTRPTVLAATAIGCFLLAACAKQAPPSGLVISDVTVVSPERAAVLEHAYVRIVDGKIAELSERPLRGETEIDGKGRFLVPGLIDSHVHLALPPGFPAPMNSEQAAAHPEIVAAALEQDPRSFLYFGFTTVIDLVGTAERTAQWNARELRPDAHFCGATAIINGQVRRILYPYFSYGLPWEKRMVPVTDATQQTPEAVVARIVADGAICVKTVDEAGIPGVMDGIMPTVDEGRALVAAAHARSLPVLIHANRVKSQAFAVAAGVDVIVHGMWRNPDDPMALDDEAREVLAGVVRGNIGYQPTTQVIAGFVDMHPRGLSTAVRSGQCLSALVDRFVRQGRSRRRARLDQERHADGIAGARDTVGRGIEVTRILAKADARLLFGSDTPSDLIYSNPPGSTAGWR